MPATRRWLFILAEPRSGSSWLLDTLNSHRRIQLQGELLNHALHKEVAKYPGGTARDFDGCLAYLGNCLQTVIKRNCSYYGCKILLNQLTYIGEGFPAEFLHRYRDASVIFLYRENLAAGHISLQIAHRYGIWHVNRNDEVTMKKIHIRPAVMAGHLKRDLQRRDNIRHLLETVPISYHALSYETLFRDRTGSLNGICGFLGLPDRRLVFSKELKGNPFRPGDVIENYRELEEYFWQFPEFRGMLAGD